MGQFFQNPFAKRVRAFCAFCKTPRQIYRKKRIGFFDFAVATLGALVIMGFVFQDWDARAILFFVALLAISETFIQLRWRMGLVCQHCGFDPLLYLKKPELAAAKVKLHLDFRKEDPAALLANPLNLPTRKAPPPTNPDGSPKKGTRLSRQV